MFSCKNGSRNLTSKYLHIYLEDASKLSSVFSFDHITIDFKLSELPDKGEKT